ncbi:hypothetical protein TWF506_000437 [Arthrobotrys conoides]|uniref:Uncharacterized protein n=1 Tax=Arthrobotrys conoides TaxID=74498 RepID=A0AAN8NKY7_9PEZI
MGCGDVGSFLTEGMDNSIDVLHEEILDQLGGGPEYLNRIPGIRTDIFDIRGSDVKTAIERYQAESKGGNECSSTPASSLRNGAIKTSKQIKGPEIQETGGRCRSKQPQIATTKGDNELELRRSSAQPAGWRRAARYQASPEIETSRISEIDISSDTDRNTISPELANSDFEIPSTDDEDPIPSSSRKRRAPRKLGQSKRNRTGIGSKTPEASNNVQVAVEIHESRIKNTTPSPKTRTRTLRGASAIQETGGSTSSSRRSVESSLEQSQATKGSPSTESRDILNESKTLCNLAKIHLASQNSGQKYALLEKRLNAFDERIKRLTEEVDEIKNVLKEVNGTLGTLLAFCKGQDL